MIPVTSVEEKVGAGYSSNLLRLVEFCILYINFLLWFLILLFLVYFVSNLLSEFTDLVQNSSEVYVILYFHQYPIEHDNFLI